VRGSIITYIEMCRVENASLQRGMNFRPAGRRSIFLMSTRKGAPYRDRVEDDGLTLIYEGHDAPKNSVSGDPKKFDQPARHASGKMTENGKFLGTVQRYKSSTEPPELVKIYEKIKDGIWADNGVFQLVDGWSEHDGSRSVFKFQLKAIEGEEAIQGTAKSLPPRARMIPSSVKQEVWLRDEGKCKICGSNDELHFDHIIPYSKGGSSMIAANVQLLCARHNLGKSAKIE
jgi:hypothetical protein